jgi:hypothetical protein
MSQQNFNDTIPSAPSGAVNIKWQGDASNPRNISAYVELTAIGGVDTQSGASYTIAASDVAKLVLFTDSSAIAVTLPAATVSGFGNGFYFLAKAGAAGTVTITPTTSTINGASTLVLTSGQWAVIFSDGTNYFACVSSGGSTSTPGPYTDDTAAAGAGVSVGSQYYNNDGFVVVRTV